MKNGNKKILVVIAIMAVLFVIFGHGTKKEYAGDCDVLNSYRCRDIDTRDKCRDWDGDGDLEWNIWNNCAEGRICVEGECVEGNPTCTDTDGGIKYNIPGTVSNGLNEWDDICLSGTKTLYEYYCEGSSPDYKVYECPGYCTYNKCTELQCNTDADSDCNGEVSDSELLVYAQEWLDNKISDSQLLQAAGAWLS